MIVIICKAGGITNSQSLAESTKIQATPALVTFSYDTGSVVRPTLVEATKIQITPAFSSFNYQNTAKPNSLSETTKIQITPAFVSFNYA
jgi:hypothetical protein